MQDFAEKFRIQSKEFTDKFMAFNENVFEKYKDAEEIPPEPINTEDGDEINKEIEKQSSEVKIIV